MKNRNQQEQEKGQKKEKPSMRTRFIEFVNNAIAGEINARVEVAQEVIGKSKGYKLVERDQSSGPLYDRLWWGKDGTKAEKTPLLSAAKNTYPENGTKTTYQSALGGEDVETQAEIRHEGVWN